MCIRDRLFGIPAEKDDAGTSAYDEEGIIQMAIAALKEEVPELIVITDVCLCEYTSHGHCGIVKDGDVDNDMTLEMLAKTALSHAEAGADIIAPSDMICLLYTSPSPRDRTRSRMPSSA